MRLYIASDFQCSLGQLDKLSKSIKKTRPDLLIFCGNILVPGIMFQEWETAIREGRRARRNLPTIKEEIERGKNIFFQFFKTLSLTGVPGLIVPGDSDAPLQYLQDILKNFQPNLLYLHQDKIDWDNYMFLGYGGKIVENEGFVSEEHFAVYYPFSMLRYKFRKFKYSMYPKVFILNTPPFSNLDLDRSEQHTGCKSINDLIVEFSPFLLLSGSANSRQGIDFVHNTWVINPGSMKDGKFSLFDLENSEYYAESF
ncbi:MAG: hypothetical protein PHW04_13845 [Candidatus Wallbacteria bacterium]|nr:hypothetical protein [Candidatus Wallbacteria bacterium]